MCVLFTALCGGKRFRRNFLNRPVSARAKLGFRIALYLALNCTLLGWSCHALALNAALDVSQYRHTAWRIREGFTNGSIWGIAQTPDGYLWLGTEIGISRFDGVRNVPWQPPAPLPDAQIRVLLAARDGTLWLGTH